MRRLQEDALEKLRLGITSLDEIQRVVPLKSQAPVCMHRGGRDSSRIPLLPVLRPNADGEGASSTRIVV